MIEVLVQPLSGQQIYYSGVPAGFLENHTLTTLIVKFDERRPGWISIGEANRPPAAPPKPKCVCTADQLVWGGCKCGGS